MTFMETLLLIKMIEIEGGSGEGQSNKKTLQLRHSVRMDRKFQAHCILFETQAENKRSLKFHVDDQIMALFTILVIWNTHSPKITILSPFICLAFISC